MRTTLSSLLIILSLFSCTTRDSDQKKLIVDYQGKEMSDDDLRAFMEAEMKNFENINTPRNISVTKVDNVKQSMPNWFNTDLRYRNMDPYNTDDKIIQPYLLGNLSSKDFLTILDTLNDDVKRSVPQFFTKQYYPKVKDDRAVLDKILAIDKSLVRGEYGFLIRCTQQVDGYQKAIEDSIQSNTFFIKYYNNRTSYLARYAETADHKATLSLLHTAVQKMPAGEDLSGYDQHYLNPFEYLMLNGDETIRTKTRKLLFEYLGKASLSAFSYVSFIFKDEISEELKQLINQKRAQIAAISDPEEKKNSESSFKDAYLRHYARNFGIASLPYISDLILKSDDSYYAFPAISEMARYAKLSDADKTNIVDLLKKIDQQKPGRYLSQFADILKELYPDKSTSDFASMFTDEANEWPGYWNKRLYSVDSLDYYLGYFKAIGFKLTEMSKQERYLFLKDNQHQRSAWLIFSLLEHFGVAVSYDCETGMWPNPYDALLGDYLQVCDTDLKNYYGLYQYEKLNEDPDTKYTAMVTDGTKGYVANPEDGSDWYDPVTVEALLNLALKDNGVDKRFQQLSTGDQTVFTVYCSPGQFKLMVSKFGLPLPGAENEEY